MQNMLPVMRDLLDITAAMQTAERIKAYSADRISAIVNRIPPSHLLPAQARVIIDALAERRAKLPDAVATLAK